MSTVKSENFLPPICAVKKTHNQKNYHNLKLLTTERKSMVLTSYMKWILVLIYFPKIIEHKNALIEAGNHVNQFVPKAFEISTKRLQEHDKSKFDLEELLPYAKKFAKSNLEFFEKKFMLERMLDTDRALEEIENCEYEGIGKLGDILADFERILFERSLGRDERSEALLSINSEREKLLSIEATSEEWEKALNHHYDHNDHHIEFWNRKGSYSNCAQKK